VTGVACGLQNRYGAFARPGWVRFPHVPASLRAGLMAAFILASATPGLLAQDPPATPDTATTSVPAGAVNDSVPPVTPLGAFARSLVLPGWGQVEVGRPARGAIYFGAASASLFMVFKSAQKLSAARKADPPSEGVIEARKGQRENWIVVTVFIAFLSGIDAWVSTHFWDFEASIQPPPDGAPGAAFGFRIDVP
jgi:hypothetical protein